MSNPSSDATQPSGTSGKAIASLICGLLAIGCSILTGLPAIILGILGISDVNRSQGRVGGKGLAIAGIVFGSLGTLLSCIPLGLLLPAIVAAREEARLISSQNQLKEIGLALMQYHDREGHFPQVSDKSSGEPISWRVQITPYLEQANIWAAYKKNEAWDSASNKQLIDAMPRVFKSPGDSDDRPGMTNVVAIVGDDTMWPVDKAVAIRDASDGTSFTIMVVEVAGLKIPWTEPRDITLDEFLNLNNAGGPRSIYARGLVVALVDGSVMVLDADTARDKLRAMATRNGGEPNR